MESLVSVCIITYNQEKYLAQTIEGVLMQQTSFSVNVVIGEDNSSDGTRQIAADYASRFPAQITVLTRPHNVGMMPNFIDSINHCTGKYVAICEGDDYWTDPFKLQKQVDFLEQNPDYAICFTRVDEEVDGKCHVAPINPWDDERTFTIQDLAQGNFIHTPSVMFRNGLIDKFPDWFSTSPVGDYVLHLLNARHGLIKYLPDITAVYRRFAGTWSSKSMLYQFEKFSKAIDLLITEDFTLEIKEKLLAQKQLYAQESFKILLRQDDFSYLAAMQAHLEELGVKSDFVTDWMLNVYPETIRRIQAMWPYRLYRRVNALLARLRRTLGAGKRAVRQLLPNAH